MDLKVEFRNVFRLVQKNLKVLLRSKASSLIIILGPLLIILLAGLAFDNTNSYSLKVGIYSPNKTEIVSSFEEKLSEQFKVIEFEDGDECVASIEKDDVHTCMIFSENFVLAQPPNNEVKFFVDYSKINLVWTVLNVMNTKISGRVVELSQNLTGILLSTLEDIDEEVEKRRSSLVKLTTENDLINRNAANLGADLGDIDLSFDPSAFKVDALNSELNKVKQWLDTAISLGTEGLNKASSFIDSAGGIAGESASDSLKSSVDKIIALKARLATTKNLSSAEFAKFSAVVADVISQIQDTKTQLDSADSSRQLGVRVLDAVRALLDESLISLMGVQSSFDFIQNSIDSIEIRNPEAISQPIVTSIKPISSKETYLNYLFPSLIILVLMFTALLIVPTLILLEKNNPASFRNFMTPVSDVSFFVSTFFTALVILSLQSLIVLSITSLFFNTQVMDHLGSVLLILFAAMVLFIFLGMIIGYLFKSEETAILGGVTLGSVLIFISNLVIPIESMPVLVSSLASLNPFVIASDLLRKSLMFNSALSVLFDRFLLLILFAVLFAVLAVVVFFATRKSALRHLIKKLAPVVRYVRIRRV